MATAPDPAMSEEEQQSWYERIDGDAAYCPACQMWLNGPTQWTDHLIGKKHRKHTRAYRNWQVAQLGAASAAAPLQGRAMGFVTGGGNRQGFLPPPPGLDMQERAMARSTIRALAALNVVLRHMGLAGRAHLTQWVSFGRTCADGAAQFPPAHASHENAVIEMIENEIGQANQEAQTRAAEQRSLARLAAFEDSD